MEDEIETVIREWTQSPARQYLYHFTRARNLPSISHFDTLFSSGTFAPADRGTRRSQPVEVKAGPFTITLNAHLRIPDSMMSPSTTQEQFRACLDRHVFFWPTLRDCRCMMETYHKREPEESFAVLKLDAYALLRDHYPDVRISKYDSGSSPRFPKSCTYRKSPDILLPLVCYKKRTDRTVPSKASDIKEILVERRVNNLSGYLISIYVQPGAAVPDRWRALVRPYADLYNARSEPSSRT